MDEVIDITACIAKGKILKVDNKEYEVKFDFRALQVLEQQYETVGNAIKNFFDENKIYANVANFLYAACGEKYKLKKTDIEEWISVSSIGILYNLIYEAVLGSFGNKTDEQGEK